MGREPPARAASETEPVEGARGFRAEEPCGEGDCLHDPEP